METHNLFLTDNPDSKNAYLSMIEKTARAVTESFTNADAYSSLTPDALKAVLSGTDLLPQNPLGFDEVLSRAQKTILPHLLRPSSTDYMAHLHSAPTLEGIASELLIASFNQSMDSWDQSPAATEIELNVTRFLCTLFGYGAGADGIFTSGGTQSNQTALLLARDTFITNTLKHDVKKHGLPPDFRKLRIYTSCVSHFSVEKSAHIMGLGYESVVKVPVDSAMRMDVNALTRLVQSDIANGNIPFLAVATVGTTDFGSIDPLHNIADLCAQHGMLLHADAAYGSGVVLSEKYRTRIDGLERCDSITVDFHKMFLMPISCSCVLVKDGTRFDALTIHADYLNRTEDEEDGYTNLVDKSLQTTRRFDALKVWIAFQTRGKTEWAGIIDACIDNARYLYKCLLSASDFEVLTEPEISSVVFRFIPNDDASYKENASNGGASCNGDASSSTTDTSSNKDASNGGASQNDDASCGATDNINKRIRRSLIHENGIIIGQTAHEGRVYLKCTLLNPLVCATTIDSLLERIRSIGKDFSASA